jgi:beta-galactosidase
MSMHFGASYYPPHHDPSDWERDVRRMAAAGLTVVRTAELLASWDRIEKEPRQPDFAWLDAFFDLCEKHDLKVLLGTGACNPPIWMRGEYPDLQIVSRDGVPYPTGGMWGWACINHPAYLEESDRYLLQLIARYRDRAALMGWQIHNEPGYPFIPRKGQDPDWYDYNPYTVAAFQTWLERKYATIDALNIAWRWDPTHHQYRSFDEIPAPRVLPSEWGVIGAWLDWRAFTVDNWTSLVQRQHEFIKAHDPTRLTTTNLMGEATDTTGRLGVDPWKLAEVVDAIGFDLYPGLKEHGVPERGREPAGRHFVSWFLDFGRSTALHAGKAFWLPEMESGPLDGWVKGPRYTTRARDIRRWALEALGHGASMILYQGYREWNCIPIHWGALVDLHGEPTERYEAAAQLGVLFREHAELFTQARPVRAQVALLYNHSNVLAVSGLDASDFMRRGLMGAHEMLWRQGHPVEFVTPERVLDAPYKALLLPFAVQLSAEFCAALKTFVERGGILLGFARCAMLDERGWYWNTRPGGGLDEVFGVKERWIEVQPSPEFTLTMDRHRYRLPGFHHRQDLHVTTADVVGRWLDGAPAVTRNCYGQGVAYYFGTHFDLAGAGQRAHAEALDRLLIGEGVTKPVLVHGTANELVDVHLLHAREAYVLITTNENDRETGVQLELPGVKVSRARDLFGENDMEVKLRPSGDVLELVLPARDGTALLLETS